MLKAIQLQRIYDYNAERGLNTYNEEKELGFKIEEIDEWYKAKTPGEKVDALCDLIVFSGGVMYKNGYEVKDIQMHLTRDSMKEIIHSIISENIVIRTSLRMIEDMGYDSSMCMDEVLKHIESRKGELNKETGKFEKYTDDAHKALWYEPNYANCTYIKQEKSLMDPA